MDSKPVALRLTLPYKGEREFIERYAPHIARGGVFVATRNPKPEGTLVSFEFRLADNSCPLSGEGVVIKAQGADAGARAGMTIRFTRLSEQGKAVVERALALKGEGPGAEVEAATSAAAAPWLQSPSPVPLDVAEARRRRREDLLAGPQAKAASQPAPVIGIDFGTCHCRASVFSGGRSQPLVLEGKSTAMPSVVAFDAKGRVLVGNRARAHALLDPRHGVYASKRLLAQPAASEGVNRLRPFLPFEIGSDARGDVALQVRERIVPMTEIVGHLFAEVRDRTSEQLDKPVARAVIAVPATFGHARRAAIRDAASRAGLAVERLIDDSTAVALAYSHGRGLPRRRALVFDLGGGTFTVSVIQMTGDDVEVIATAGDDELGGLDFDLRIAEELRRRFAEATGIAVDDPLAVQRLREAAEAAKILLSEKTETPARVPSAASRDGSPIDLDLLVSRARVEAACGDLVERAISLGRQLLGERGLSPSSIDEILVVGGQSRSPGVRGAIEQAFGRPLRTDIDGATAVAGGAAIAAYAFDDVEPRAQALHLVDVLGAPVGVASRDGRLHRVLDRNTRLPCHKSLSLPPSAAGARLAVFQGSSTATHAFQGSVALAAHGSEGSAVMFSVSVDGLVTVSVGRGDGSLAPLDLDRSGASPEALEALFRSSPLPGADEGQSVFAKLRGLFVADPRR